MNRLYMDVESFYKLRLFDRNRLQMLDQFVTNEESWRILSFLIEKNCPEDARTLIDKSAFIDLCRSGDLPICDNLARFEGGQVRLLAKTAAFSTDLFCKPEKDQCGHGLRMWRYAGENVYLDPEGNHHTLYGLFESLKGQSTASPLLLQKRLRNHHDLTGLSPNALSTVRVVTCKDPGEPVEHLISAYRIPTGSSIGDNFALDGLAAGVDPATGILTSAVFKDPTRGFARFTHHPDTGAPIAGFKLPFWPETLELAKRAHALMPRMAFVGWDIAILETGPVLVEGNDLWCVDVVQMGNECPLGQTKFFECFYRHLRVIEERPDGTQDHPDRQS